MIEVIRTTDFDEWLTKLKDKAGRLRILKRIDRLANGNPGDAKSVGGGVLELRLDIGPGYRVYYTRHGDGDCRAWRGHLSWLAGMAGLEGCCYAQAVSAGVPRRCREGRPQSSRGGDARASRC